MREFIIRDWKAQEAAASDEEAGMEENPGAEPAPRTEPAPRPEPELRAEAGPASDPAPRVEEPEDETLGGAIRVKRFQAVRAASRESEEETAGGAKAAPRKRGERRFIIAYDGIFVGFFEATAEVTPREAYVRVAQDLAEDESFDPEKLALYKPVLLRSARPGRGVNVIRGKMARLSWQPKKAPIVPGAEPSAPPAAEKTSGT